MRTGAVIEGYINGVRVSVYEKDRQRLVYGGDVVKAMNLEHKDPHHSRILSRNLKEEADYYYMKSNPNSKYERVFLTKLGVSNVRLIDEGEKRQEEFIPNERIEQIIELMEKDRAKVIHEGGTDSYLIDIMEDIDRRLIDLEDVVESIDNYQSIMMGMMSAYQAEIKTTMCQALGMICEGFSGMPLQKNREIKSQISQLGVMLRKEAKRAADYMEKIEKKGLIPNEFFDNGRNDKGSSEEKEH